MTKKDYELIARVLLDSKKYINPVNHWALCRNFADVLQKDNTRFNHDKFLKACGL